VFKATVYQIVKDMIQCRSRLPQVVNMAPVVVRGTKKRTVTNLDSRIVLRSSFSHV
jgi:hypothetical protein